MTSSRHNNIYVSVATTSRKAMHQRAVSSSSRRHASEFSRRSTEPSKSRRPELNIFDFEESIYEIAIYSAAVIVPALLHAAFVQRQDDEMRSYLDATLIFLVICCICTTLVPGNAFNSQSRLVRTSIYLLSSSIGACAGFSIAGSISPSIGIFYVGYQIYSWIRFNYTQRENKIYNIAAAAKNFLLSYRKGPEMSVSVDIFIEEFLDNEKIHDVALRKRMKSMWSQVEAVLLDDKRWRRTAVKRPLAVEGIEYRYNYHGNATFASSS
jgi:hypothetical protein